MKKGKFEARCLTKSISSTREGVFRKENTTVPNSELEQLMNLTQTLEETIGSVLSSATFVAQTSSTESHLG